MDNLYIHKSGKICFEGGCSRPIIKTYLTADSISGSNFLWSVCKEGLLRLKISGYMISQYMIHTEVSTAEANLYNIKYG